MYEIPEDALLLQVFKNGLEWNGMEWNGVLYYVMLCHM